MDLIDDHEFWNVVVNPIFWLVSQVFGLEMDLHRVLKIGDIEELEVLEDSTVLVAVVGCSTQWNEWESCE